MTASVRGSARIQALPRDARRSDLPCRRACAVAASLTAPEKTR